MSYFKLIELLSYKKKKGKLYLLLLRHCWSDSLSIDTRTQYQRCPWTWTGASSTFLFAVNNLKKWFKYNTDHRYILHASLAARAIH